MHNEQLMGIRGEEEMEMSDDDMDDSSATNSKDSEDLGKNNCGLTLKRVKVLNDAGCCHLIPCLLVL